MKLRYFLTSNPLTRKTSFSLKLLREQFEPEEDWTSTLWLSAIWICFMTQCQHNFLLWYIQLHKFDIKRFYEELIQLCLPDIPWLIDDFCHEVLKTRIWKRSITCGLMELISFLSVTVAHFFPFPYFLKRIFTGFLEAIPIPGFLLHVIRNLRCWEVICQHSITVRYVTCMHASVVVHWADFFLAHKNVFMGILWMNSVLVSLQHRLYPCLGGSGASQVPVLKDIFL